MHFFPLCQPFNSGFIRRDAFSVYFEESGNPQGQPVFLLHGGPGSGLNPARRQHFDPDHFRLIMFDQRGCGKSAPALELEHNDTSALISDIKALKEHLQTGPFILCGGSWGSTLALLYAQAHPEDVTALVLDGVFLARQSDLHWYSMPHGVPRFFPEVYAQMIALVPPEKRLTFTSIASHYQGLMACEDASIREDASYRWIKYQDRFCALDVDLDALEISSKSARALQKAKLMNHYEVNGFFMEENQILNNIDVIRHIPLRIVQGRYDMICPPGSAFELAEAHGHARLAIVEDSGHVMSVSLQQQFMRFIHEFKKV